MTWNSFSSWSEWLKRNARFHCCDCHAPSPTYRCPECSARKAAALGDMTEQNMTVYPDLPPFDQAGQVNHVDQAETQPKIAALPRPLDEHMDEFGAFLHWIRALPVSIPARRYWSGMCPWCCMEMHELSEDHFPLKPPAEKLNICARHLTGLTALEKWRKSQEGGAA